MSNKTLKSGSQRSFSKKIPQNQMDVQMTQETKKNEDYDEISQIEAQKALKKVQEKQVEVRKLLELKVDEEQFFVTKNYLHNKFSNLETSKFKIVFDQNDGGRNPTMSFNQSQRQTQEPNKKLIQQARVQAVNKFMRFYDQIANQTIHNHNSNIYQELRNFVKESSGLMGKSIFERVNVSKTSDGLLKVQGIGASSLIGNGDSFFHNHLPTSVIVTSNESVSSIDTQFNSLCDELANTINSINLIIDERKCISFKLAMHHLQTKLEAFLGISSEEGSENQPLKDMKILANRVERAEQEKDENKIVIQQEDLDFIEDTIFQPRPSLDDSNYVSTIKDPMESDIKEPNERNSYELNETINSNFQKQERPNLIIRTRNQKEREKIYQDQNYGYYCSEYDDRAFQSNNLAQILQENEQKDDLLTKETMFGFKNILKKALIDPKRPILIIIKNMKQMPHQVLNELIHVFHIFRGKPHFVNLNLVIGIQSNSWDEVQVKLTIQNCVKLTVKKYFFPSMKHIIFETISHILKKRENILTFEPATIQTIIQQINMFGMSIQRFRHSLKVLISRHLFETNQRYVFLNLIPLILCTKKEWTEVYHQQVIDTLNVYETNVLNNRQEDIDQTHVDTTCSSLMRYLSLRRHFLKAYEVLEDLALKNYIYIQTADKSPSSFKIDLNKSEQRKNEISDDNQDDFEDSVSKQEQSIFKYQFVLNYMSKPNIKEKFHYMLSLFTLNSSWECIIKKMLIPCLESKLKKVNIQDGGKKVLETKQVERQSKFIKQEMIKLQRMLSGQYEYQKQSKYDQDMKNKIDKSTSMSQDTQLGKSSRYAKLLGNGKNNSSPMASASKIPEKFKEEDQEKNYLKFAPKTQDQFQKLFKDWLQQFHELYLQTDGKSKSQSITNVMTVHANNFMAKVAPDLQGTLIQSIIQSDKILDSCLEQELDNLCVEKIELDKIKSVNQNYNNRDQGEINLDNLDFKYETSRIMLEILRTTGRDFSLLEMFDAFKTTHKKFEVGYKKQQFTKPQLKSDSSISDEFEKEAKKIHILVRKMYEEEKDEIINISETDLVNIFINAIKELRYLGLISSTSKNTFIFKKNFFGKASMVKVISKELIQKDNKAIERQFGQL